MKLIKTEDAVGHVLCHDMTQIIPGVIKDAVFRKGHVVTAEDIPVLLSMGKENLYVWEKKEGILHEDEAAEILRDICMGDHMQAGEPKEGKIEIRSEMDGLFKVDTKRLNAVNALGEMMIASRHGNFPVKAGDKLAATRIIPLVIEQEKMEAAKEAAAMPDAPASFDSHADFGDILAHGFFSISLFSLLILVLSIASAVFSIREAIFSGSTEGLAGFLVSFLVIFGLFASSFWDIARGFIQYYNFRVRRTEDRLYIQYGLLRKVSYTVPVDKIQALKINQTLSARIGGRYMAEIINIGMGDEGNDRNSFLVLYCRKDTLLKRLSSLLPEFADSLELDVQRQPARVWAVWLIPFGIAGLLLGFLSWSLYWFQILTAFWCIAAPVLMAGGCLLLMILRYLTCGCALKEDYVLAVNGYLGRRVTMAAYHQIQYVELKQNPLAALLHLQKGRLHLLAGAGNQIHDLPYFSSKKIDFFRRRLLHSKEQRGYTNPINEKGEQA